MMLLPSLLEIINIEYFLYCRNYDLDTARIIKHHKRYKNVPSTNVKMVNITGGERNH